MKPEKFKLTHPQELTPEEEARVNEILQDKDFKIVTVEDGSTNPETNTADTTPETVADSDFADTTPETVADSILLEEDPHNNAGLIRKHGQPEIAGMTVVEPITKLNISTDALKSTPAVTTEPIRIDKKFAPSTREEERAKAREAARAKPWWKKIIGG